MAFRYCIGLRLVKLDGRFEVLVIWLILVWYRLIVDKKLVIREFVENLSRYNLS